MINYFNVSQTDFKKPHPKISIYNFFNYLQSYSNDLFNTRCPKPSGTSYNEWALLKFFIRFTHQLKRTSTYSICDPDVFIESLSIFIQEFDWNKFIDSEKVAAFLSFPQQEYNYVLTSNEITKVEIQNFLTQGDQKEELVSIFNEESVTTHFNEIIDFFYYGCTSFTLKEACRFTLGQDTIISPIPKALTNMIVTEDILKLTSQSPMSTSSDMYASRGNSWRRNPAWICMDDSSMREYHISSPKKINSPLPLVSHGVSSDFKTIHPEDLDTLLSEGSANLFHLPNFNSSKVKNPDPVWKNATKAVIKRRKGFFLPYLEAIKIYESDFKFSQGYCLKFLNIDQKNISLPDMFARFKNPKSSFTMFYDFITSYDGLYFINKQKYKEAISNGFKTIFPYALKDDYSATSSVFVNLLQKNHKYILSLINSNVNVKDLSPLDYIKTQSIEMRVKENKKLDKRILKAKNYYESLRKDFISNLSLIKTHYAAKATSVGMELYSKFFALNREEFFKLPKIINFSYEINKLEQVKSEQISEAIKTNSFDRNLFLQNLYNDDIKLIEITYAKEYGLESKDYELTVINQDTSPHDVYKFFSSDSYQNKRTLIKSVVFLIDKPVLIYVNNKASPKAIKLGGPYYVKVKKASIEIALKNYQSFFGISENSYWVHPHSGSRDLMHLTEWATGCLGEAQSLIYNAFNKNSLQEIILSALIWVTSANSADPWGRNYTKFINASDLILETNAQDQLITSEEDVKTFLSSELDPISEEITPPETPPDPPEEQVEVENQNTQEPYSSEDFTLEQQNYIRYT